MVQNEIITLYHGSYCEVAAPDLSRCSRYKDFGQGFYLTTSKEQAMRFSLTSLKKAAAKGVVSEKQKYGVVSVFSSCTDKLSRLDVCRFKKADEEWLGCVTGHRKGSIYADDVKQYEKFDIITGKVANDATNATITAYMAGLYGDVGSERAKELCISLLLPERLKDQYCFRTQRALDILDFTESFRVWK